MKKIVNDIELLHPLATVPTHGTDFAMGYDIYCVGGLEGLPDGHKWPKGQLEAWERFQESDQVTLYPQQGFIFRTGIAIAIEPGYGCLLWDRSGNGAMKMIGKLAGVIDEDYRGEWFVRLVNHSGIPVTFRQRDKIVQGIFQERIEAAFNQTTNLPPSDRGLKWAGSTDAT